MVQSPDSQSGAAFLAIHVRNHPTVLKINHPKLEISYDNSAET